MRSFFENLTKKTIVIMALALACIMSFSIACTQPEPPTPEDVYHSVTFVQEGQENVVKQVIDGGTLTDIPTPVYESGYSIYWDRTDFSNITEDITVTAIKEPVNVTEYVTITFIQEGQNNVVKQVVKGGTLTDIPIPVAEEGYDICWDRTDFTNITSNITVTAVKTLIEVADPADYVDFIVNVESGREIRVLQITDIQTMDRAQKRYINRVSSSAVADTLNGYEKYIGQVILAYKPDLIIMTGDNVYGEFDDSGYQFKELIRIMDSFKIPWAPIFGNHDNESNMGVDWQCKQYEDSEYCLFKQRTLTGNGNYSVGLVQDGELKRVFYMLDSNGCSSMSALSFANGHSKKTIGFGDDQIEWYTTSINTLKSKFPNVKLSMAFHIQLAVFADAFEKYGYDSATIRNNPINLENLPEAKAVGDFGYIGRPLKGAWDTDGVVWNGIKALGVDSIFVGHEHCNSASVTYQGVRLTYGQKSSTFDRYNCIENGVYYEFANGIKRDPVMGGTYFNLSADGSIADAGLYLYDKNVAYVETEKEQAAPYPETDVENRIYYDETVVNYSIKNLSGKKDELLGGESMFLPIDGDAYSLSFAFTPNTFNGTLTISGFVGSATSSNGIKVTLNNNKITIGLSSVNYTFINGTMYDVEVGFVNLYNGNTTYVFVIIDGQTVAWEFVETKGRDSGNVLISANSTGDKFTFGLVSTLDTSAKNEWALGNKDVTATFNYDLKNSEYGENNWYYGAVTEYTNLADCNSYLQAEGFWTKQDYYNMNFRPLFYQTVPNAINPSINLGYYSGDFMMASHAVHSIKADTTTGGNNRFANFDYQGLVYTFTDLETGNYFNLKVYSKVAADNSTLQRGYIQISYNGGDYSADKLTYYYFGGQYRLSAGNAESETFHFLNIKYDKDSNSIKHSSKLTNEIKLSDLGIPAFNNYKVDMEFLSVRTGRTAGLMVYYLNGYDLTTIESKEDLESNENVLYIKSNNFEVASGASISIDDVVGVYNSASGEVEKDFTITIKDTAQNQVSIVDKKFIALAGKYNVVATLGTNTLSFMINISIT